MTVLAVDSLFTGLSLRASRVARRASLADAGADRQVLPAGGLAWLQPDVLARRLPRVPGPLENPAGHCSRCCPSACRSASGSSSSRWCRRDRRATCCCSASARSATALNVVAPRRVRAGPDEPGTDVPICGRNDALADQVRGPGPGGDLRRPRLRPEPGDSLFRLRHGPVGRRVERAPDRMPLPGAGLRAHRVRRDRRVPLAGRPAVVAHGAHRRRIPLHRRRPGPDRAGASAERRASSSRSSSCSWEWRAWRCCCSPTASGSAFTGSSAATSGRPSTIPSGSGPSCSRRLANVKDQAGLCAASARLISETFDVLSVTVWLLDEQKERFIVGASTARPPGEADAWRSTCGCVKRRCGRAAERGPRRSTWKR